MRLTARTRVVAFYVDLDRENARSMALRVADRFRQAGYEAALCPGSDTQLPIATNGAAMRDASLLITIGGDGTLLRAARAVVEDGIPILGINTGRLGFLTEFDEDDPRIDQLPQLLERGLEIEERIALLAICGAQRFFALNDVIVRKGDVSRLVPFALSLDDEEAAHVPADGVCVCTPTGSTAYFLSAGGSIVSPQVDAFGIVPLLPHTLFSRPLIVPASSRISVRCDSADAPVHLECDGDRMCDLDPGAAVAIERHPRKVLFARSAPLHFFERLGEKMRWGVSIKDKRQS